MQEAAKRYLSAGLCALPAKRAQKRPALRSWKEYQSRLPTEAEIDAWFAGKHDALCLLTGAASGNLELLDFDLGGELYEAWSTMVDAELLDRLVIETSQSGGWHVVYRCEGPIGGNMKLAQRPRAATSSPSAAQGIVTLIETRGDGGLFLCAPTQGYEVIQGDLADPPVLSEAERETLLQAAWGLNEYWPEPRPCPPTSAHVGPVSTIGVQLRPGDDFNTRGDLGALLVKHGWRFRGEWADGNGHWTRPGKNFGTSATVKDRTLYVFSSNATPFEPNQAYSPFAVCALLEHNGDFAEATRALSAEGFGDKAMDLAGVDISAIVGQAEQRQLGSNRGDQGVLDEDVMEETTTQSPTALGKLDTAPSRKLQLVRADLIEMRPPDWLLRGTLERDTFALIFGDPGCGKSFLAIDWACRVATQTPWRGNGVQAGSVVYVAGEGQQGFGRRIRAWSDCNGVDLTGIPLFVAPAVAIPNPTDLVALVGAIDASAGRPALIVVDTLARCFGGGDENSTQDMSQFVSACDVIRRRYGCTILVVHHTGHGDKSRARGAIALKAALDAEYRLENNDHLVLTATKMKDAETPSPVTMELVTVELPGLVDEHGNPVTSAAINVLDADISALVSNVTSGKRGKWQRIGLEIAQQLIAANKDARAATKDWHHQCEESGMQKSTRYDVLAKLHSHGDVTVNGDWMFPV